MQGECQTCHRVVEIDKVWGICQRCTDEAKSPPQADYREPHPKCMVCRRTFRHNGDQWIGDCVHFRGKVVEW